MNTQQSSQMDSFLAELYGTNKTASAESANEDLEKEASVQLFMKLAEDQQIPIAQMPDADVQRLYATWVEKSAGVETAKTAGDDSDGDKDDKETREKAEKEHEEKKAASEKIAEADFLGRVMAHAYVQELQKIAGTGESGEGEGVEEQAEKEAAMPEALRKGLAKARGVAGTVGLAAGLTGQKAKHEAGRAGKAIAGAAGKAGKAISETAGKAGKHVSDNRTAYAAGGAGAAGAGAGYAAGRHKKASAIDALATERAVFIAHESGYDAEEAGRKVAAVAELGLLGESEKTAAAPDVDTAIGVRALEFLEAAGYDVTWNQ